MIQIHDKIISLDVLERHFMCDLDTCAGICCVHGDSGAPLEHEEIKILQQEYQNFEYAMTSKGRKAIENYGVAIYDSDNDLVTPLIDSSEECAYSYFNEENVCLCAIEKAYFDKKTPFRKPISCHLYPIRTKKIGNNIALNYHQWNVCECARVKGQQSELPVFRFLKEPLIRKFGKDFYNQLEEVERKLKVKN